MTPGEDPLVEARALLRAEGPPDLATALSVSKGLKRKQEFGVARRVLERAREHPSLTSERNRAQARQLVQQQALCHSKDTSLTYRRHYEALELLRVGADLESTTDKETLGIAGGILKRMWARSGQSRYLTQSLHCYERGYASPDGQDDYGYNGINAAFLNDQLATEDDPRTARERCQNAQYIREALVERLPSLQSQEAWLANQWWYLVTVAEALLGLHRYSDASRWLRDAQTLNVDDWEKQATATQLAELCRLHDRLGAFLPAAVHERPARLRARRGRAHPPPPSRWCAAPSRASPSPTLASRWGSRFPAAGSVPRSTTSESWRVWPTRISCAGWRSSPASRADRSWAPTTTSRSDVSSRTRRTSRLPRKTTSTWCDG